MTFTNEDLGEAIHEGCKLLKLAEPETKLQEHLGSHLLALLEEQRRRATEASAPDSGLGHDLLSRIRECLVVWRCTKCRHGLVEIPDPSNGPCPICGKASPLHEVYTPDLDRLKRILISIPGMR